MTRLAYVCVLTGCLAACKGGEGGNIAGASSRCTDWCRVLDEAVVTVQADLDAADRSASQIAKIEVKEEAQVHDAMMRAQAACGEIRGSLGHARGIAWVLSKQEPGISGRQGGQMFALEGDLTRLDDLTKTCPSDTPAKMNGALVSAVHAVKKKSPPRIDPRACVTTCEKGPKP